MSNEMLRQRLMRYLKDQEMTVGQFVYLFQDQTLRKHADAERHIRALITHGTRPDDTIGRELTVMLGSGREVVNAIEPISPQERDRIRQALIAYAKAQKPPVGAPKLAQLISRANPGKPAVSYRTLARFMTGKNVEEEGPDGESIKKNVEVLSNAAFVRWCARFVEGFQVPDPVGEIGRGLAALYGGGTGLDGTFRSLDPNWRGIIEFKPDEKFCRAHHNGGRDAVEYSDGAMVRAGSGYVAVLADRLTRKPLHLAFQSHADGTLDGHATRDMQTANVRFERFVA